MYGRGGSTFNPKQVLITGFNRTGTTFLICYYHRLGYKTGFSDAYVDRIQSRVGVGGTTNPSHGGIEILRDQRHCTAANLSKVEVIKHPYGYGETPPWENGMLSAFTFKYRILTKRDEESMIKSQLRRIHQKEDWTGRSYHIEGAKNPDLLKPHFKKEGPKFKEWLKTYIEVEFPKSTRDFEYLWSKLAPTFEDRVSKEQAEIVWKNLVKQEYINYD